jgi:hypothetical protein
VVFKRFLQIKLKERHDLLKQVEVVVVLRQDLFAYVREENLLLSKLRQKDCQLFNALGQLWQTLKLNYLFEMFVDHLCPFWQIFDKFHPFFERIAIVNHNVFIFLNVVQDFLKVILKVFRLLRNSVPDFV